MHGPETGIIPLGDEIVFWLDKRLGKSHLALDGKKTPNSILGALSLFGPRYEPGESYEALDGKNVTFWAMIRKPAMCLPTIMLEKRRNASSKDYKICTCQLGLLVA